MTAEDPPFHEFLDWITDLEGEVSEEEVKKQVKIAPEWRVVWLSKQLYGISSETATGKLKETVMKREREKGDINGIRIFRDLCRDHPDASKEGKVALGQRIVKPARADMDSFEDRLRAWEEDVERLNRITEKDVDDSLKPVYLEDIMQVSLKDRYNLEKHNLREYGKLKIWFDRMILEHKSNKARPRGLHELEVQEAGAKEEPEDNMLYSLLLHAKESDVAKVLGPEEMLTFQRWKTGVGKGGGGKGGNKLPKGGGAGGKGNYSSSPATTGGYPPSTAVAAVTTRGEPFDGI